ncbi:nucleolar pre-ribosomal-associated protein 1 isoform X2 [Athalia rosae]|nr:nucleolar pre-ribosomal-associated protein 1 isoform X2 [Athalia rosae]XP_012269210.2 nucleolar pre-ribosomal-associated protein 1 isoform X2 [Athalia rosae]XP_048514756.1 nucleolar pre-ribosomal-associated protein 1 isoform X2 [Athalia rosae]
MTVLENDENKVSASKSNDQLAKNFEGGLKNSDMDSNDKKVKKSKKRKATKPIDDIPENENESIVTTNENNISQESSKKKKLEIVNPEENDEDSTNDEVGNSQKFTDTEARQITGKSLRASFNSADGLAVLKKFVTICNENKKLDLAVQYLDAGGSPLEILRLLETTDKKNINNATVVFSALEIVIIEILAKYPHYHSSAAEACRYLLNSHLSSIHSMLSSQSNAKQRKVVLKLLTAVVTLGGNLPRELLGHLSLHFQVLDTLSRHTQPTDSQSVRTSFIHFILSFLIEGNVSVVRTLLDKRGVLSSIFPDLIYDTHHLVNLVFTTVKTYVLENPGISKTIKLSTFSTPVIQNIVSLYNWKGPKNWPNKHRKKQAEESPGYTDPEEKKVVVEVVHEFLSTLLTSNKFGIIFHDRSLGTSGQKNNQLANTILQSLDRPWEHTKPADLVVKILVACPDLIRSQLVYTEPYLTPAISQKWILLMKFIQQIVESLNPEVCLKPCLSELTTSKLFSVVTTLTASPLILKNAIAPALNHDCLLVRHTATVLLVVMLKQLKNFMDTVRRHSLDDNETLKLQKYVTDYLQKNIPSLDTLLIAWKKTLSPNEEIEEESVAKTAGTINFPTLKESLTAILDLLLIYRDIRPQLSETSLITTSNSTSLLTGLNTIKDIDEEELGTLKVKALQFLLELDSSAFSPEKELFGETIPFLIALLDARKGPMPVSRQAKTALKALLNSCGVFEGCSYQVDIWINSCLNFENIEERLEISYWLVKIIRKTVKHVTKYVDLVIQAEEVAGEHLYSETKIDDIFTDLMERDIKIEEKKMTRMLPSVSISVLLPAAIENLQSDQSKLLLQYMSRVLVHTLHCQIAPHALIHLTKDLEALPALSYLSSWIPSHEHNSVKKPFGSKSLIYKFSKALLNERKIDLTELFEGNRKLSLQIGDEEFNFEYSMHPDEVIALYRLTIFYFTQLLQEEKLTKEMNYNIKVAVITLLHIAKDIEFTDESLNISEECCDWTLAHPVILQNFSPLHKKKNLVEKHSTEMVADVCRKMIDLFGKQKISDLIVPFKEKYMRKLMTAVNKSRNDGNVKDSPTVVRFVEILQFNTRDIIEVLTAVTELPSDKLVSTDKIQLSMWGLLVPKLVAATVGEIEDNERRKSLTLDKSLIEKIGAHMIQLISFKNKNLDIWIDSLFAHLKRFPHNIAGVDRNMLLSLIKGKHSLLATELASFLISRNIKFVSVYVKYAMSNVEALKDRDTVFSILSSMLDNEAQPQFYPKLYELYKEEILGWFSDPETVNPSIKRNIKAAVKLIETVVDVETCNERCDMILSNGDKLLMVDTSYIELLQSIFTKAGKLEIIGNNRLVDFAQILIHVTVSALKKDSKNNEKHEKLCKILLETISLVDVKKSHSQCHEIQKNHSWPQFTRFSLKLGLKSSKDDNNQVLLLRTLVKLCDIVYENNSDDEYVKTLFEMTTSHSEFINTMLGTSSTKRDLIELLLVLVKKNNSLMASTHVSLYLGSYNATLNETDQLILQLLQYYESHNVKLTDYRPYLWGSTAASHYSVKSGADTALWRQPSTSQVLDLFTQEMVNSTVKDYPVSRNLVSTELHPSQSAYDPAFYLPLLCYLLSDNSVVACHKITQSGALALVLSACGSTQKQTRIAAFTVISRFYYHLEATNSKEKLLWMHFIDTFRNGISSSESELQEVELSCLVTTFMARTSLVATQPLNPLYSPLQRFLMAKPELNLTTIPEFLQLFHSSEIDYKMHRFWILEVIRDGLKTKVDTNVAFRCMIFKMLFAFYNCVLADRQTKNLILQVINSAVKIPNAALLLTTGYGLLPWLNEVTYSLNEDDLDFISIFINVIWNLFESLKKSNKKCEVLDYMLLSTMMNLKIHLSRNTDIESYKNYIVLLEKIVSTRPSVFSKSLSVNHIQELVQLSKIILGEVDECEDLMQFGAKFFMKNLNSDCQDDVAVAKNSLRKLIILVSTNK